MIPGMPSEPPETAEAARPRRPLAMADRTRNRSGNRGFSWHGARSDSEGGKCGASQAAGRARHVPEPSGCRPGIPDLPPADDKGAVSGRYQSIARQDRIRAG
jgi:hypothetical protein